MPMNQTNTYSRALIVLGLIAASLVAVYFAIQSSQNQPSPNGGVVTPEEVNFTQTGNVFIDVPGLRPGVWYLSYEEPGKPGLQVELQLSNQDSDMHAGQRVRVAGRKTGEVVAVREIEILNAYKSNLIWVESPLPNDTVINPVTVTGWAKGSWYFEASFPIQVLDGNGRVLGQGHAQAQGDWMTDTYVQFMSSVQFSAPSTTTGTLVLAKDNPSGLPQHADELRVPIQFGTEGRAVQLFYYNPSTDKDANGNILCSRQGLVAVDRQIPITNTPIQDTIKLLLQGVVTQEEKSRGVTTEFPLPGVELKGANLVGRSLTLEFADPQHKTGGGSCRVGVLWAQIEATASQFPGIAEVRFVPEELFQP